MLQMFGLQYIFFLLLNWIKEGSFYFVKEIKFAFWIHLFQRRFFFSIWVFFHNLSRIKGLQGKGEGISLTPHYHFHLLHRHLDISQVITAGSSPLHIAALPKLGTFGFCAKLVTTKLRAPRRFIFRISFQFQKL